MTKTRNAQRRDAAEDVCWSLLIAIELGGLNEVEDGWRKMIGTELGKWAELVDDPAFHKDCEDTCTNPLHKEGVDGGEGEEKAVAEPAHGILR
jgi:hypothetical protein